jgi:isopenicillin-N N-acyltransferase like protein
MRSSLVAAIAVACAVAALSGSVADAAECHGAPKPDAQPNLNPIIVGTQSFVRQVKNAKLYVVGSGDDEINVVHLWGSPYEMGYAHGTLMRETAIKFINSVWTYMESQVEGAINGTVHIFRPWFLELVANVGLDAALDLTFDATDPFTGQYFLDEMRGMADATGLDYKRIRRIHMIGELTKGACSMYGAWGAALKNTNSQLMQLRALDWDVDGPFKDFPQITVYHPTNATQGHAFANIGWTGWVGSITGISSQKMAISEIGVSFPDATFGKDSRFGTPFTFLLRDVLQFDQTLDDSINRMANAHRTCSLILGVGDGKLPAFRGVQYSHDVANFFDDQNMQPVYDWHPRMTDVVYYGMDWLCPGFNVVMNKQLTQFYGNITAENTIRSITSIVQTGDLHIAIYDLTNMVLHTANARGDGESGPAMAYDRSFVRIDMNAVFSVQPPTTW